MRRCNRIATTLGQAPLRMNEQAPAVTPDERFERSRRTFVAALGRGDAAAAAQVYADSGRILVPSTSPLDGRSAIEAFWRAGLDAGMSELELLPRSFDVDSTFACEVGDYALHAAPRDEGAVTERGRYLIVHRLEPDGAWRRALEVYAPERRDA
jgi:ketosteroid isomerase-like protein